MPNSQKHALFESRDVLNGAIESHAIIATNKTTAVKVVDAVPFARGTRRDIRFVNDGPNDIWIREFPAAESPTVKTGSVLLGRRDSVTFYDSGAIYMGEISAISANGKPDLHVTVL